MDMNELSAIPLKTYHKYRPWAGHPFGTKSVYNSYWGRYEAIEPFPGACGDCSKAKEDHVSEMSHQQKIELLRRIAAESRAMAQRTQETLEWFVSEMRRING